jgi:acetoin utilization protein AcuB
MTRDVITVNPWDTIEDALLILHQRRFGALPVVEGRKLVGIITKADILAAFIDTLRIEGIGGVRIEVILPRDADSLLRLIRRLGEMQIEIRSLVLSPLQEKFVAFLRIGTIEAATVKTRLQESGFQVPELADFLG